MDLPAAPADISHSSGRAGAQASLRFAENRVLAGEEARIYASANNHDVRNVNTWNAPCRMTLSAGPAEEVPTGADARNDALRGCDVRVRSLAQSVEGATAATVAPRRAACNHRRANMDDPLVTEEVFHLPAQRLWQALTDEHALRVWYFPQLRHFKPVVGFEFEFADDGSSYQKEWRVTQVVEGVRLAHIWRYKGYPGASEVIFDLLPEGTSTRLRVTHTGLDSFPDDLHFARRRFEEGWKQILGMKLRDYLSATG